MPTNGPEKIKFFYFSMNDFGKVAAGSITENWKTILNYQHKYQLSKINNGTKGELK